MDTVDMQGAGGGPLRRGQGETVAEHPWRDIRFHGNGAEYFRIWIVNLVLTLLTLGIYSAWATVRQRRYLYGCTEIAGSRFDFHGRPLQILLGRVIAVALLIAWTQGHLVHVGIQYGALTIVLCLFPWFMVKALRFRMRYTSLRNLRFNFHGTSAQAYRLLARYLIYAALLVATLAVFTFLTFSQLQPGQAAQQAATFVALIRFMLVYLLVMVAFAFMYPAFVCDMRNFMLNYTSYGDHDFAANLRKRDFIQYFWGAIGIAIVTTSIAMFLMMITTIGLSFLAVAGEGEPSLGGIIAGVFFGYFFIGLSALFAVAFWQARTFNLMFNNLFLENMDFRANLEVWPLTKVLIGNLLLVIFTLGLAYPWAAVRLLRYKLGSIGFRGDPDRFAGADTAAANALGDEVGQAFDLDFGFG